MLRLEKIQKQYSTGDTAVMALRGVDLAFRRAEFVSILGPSGCGKTTLLNLIGGLDHATGGELFIGGRGTSGFTDRDWDVYRNHRIGFIFQSYNLIPHQTILENVELALTIAGVDRAERLERARRTLDRVGLAGLYKKRPNQLSGGQCQRVAIARALVNDPEILLADEPTGALDTETSRQILDLIREISGERLVIMVTHNPELAEQYSTRIVRMLDGQVVGDSNPYTLEQERAAVAAEAVAEAEAEATAEATAVEGTPTEGRRRKKKPRERAKMSFFTAFRLSARNLLSKSRRTALVAVAGSIGIIGIAVVLAISSGIKGYILSMQDDMLSGNPITIEENPLDFTALSSMMDAAQKEELIREPNRVYIDSMVEYFASMGKNMAAMILKNEITPEYLAYVDAMPAEYRAAILKDYGIDFNHNLYTGFTEGGGKASQTLSVTALISIYTSILKETEFKDYASYATTLGQTFAQMPNNDGYLLSQYDLLSGRMPADKSEMLLVINRDTAVTDLLLAKLGYYTQEEFLNVVYRATEDETTANPQYDPALDRDSFSYDELLGKTFYYYPNDSIYQKTATPGSMIPFTYNAYASAMADADAMPIRIVGILQAKEEISFGCLQAGVYYTEAFADYARASAMSSEIVQQLKASEKEAYTGAVMEIPGLGATPAGGVTYTYQYTYNGETKERTAFVGTSTDFSAMMGAMMGGMMGGMPGGGTGATPPAEDTPASATLTLQALGGSETPKRVYIYPTDFDAKDHVTDYLDAWNEEGALTVGDTTLTKESRPTVNYTDSLEIIIALITGMIDAVSTALIAFTSISLVVSTVMIGVLTYVSVVERIKEIGVIRALGGRKKDVRHLFNAETFLIGLFAGLVGIGITYLISLILNAIVYALFGIPSIAALPLTSALILIALSVLLTLISGLIPASGASRRDPVVALRTE